VPRLPADIRISLKRRGGPAYHIEQWDDGIGPTGRQVLDQSARSHCDSDCRAHPALAGREHVISGNSMNSSFFGDVPTPRFYPVGLSHSISTAGRLCRSGRPLCNKRWLLRTPSDHR
jgi:hypothetical protein